MNRKKHFLLVIIVFIVTILSACNDLQSPFDRECESFNKLFIEITNSMDGYNNVIDTIRVLDNEETYKKIEQLKEIISNAEKVAKNQREKQKVSEMADYHYALEELLSYETDNSKMTFSETCDRETCYHIVYGFRKQSIDGEAF